MQVAKRPPVSRYRCRLTGCWLLALAPRLYTSSVPFFWGFCMKVAGGRVLLVLALILCPIATRLHAGERSLTPQSKSSKAADNTSAAKSPTAQGISPDGSVNPPALPSRADQSRSALKPGAEI